MLRVELRLEHFHKTLDRIRLGAAVFVQLLDLGHNLRHLVDRIVAALRRAAVAGDARHVHTDLHAAAMPAIDAAVRRLGGNNEFRRDAVLVVDILPAQAVAVLLLHGGRDKDLVARRDEAEILHDLRAVDRGHHAALLIGTAAAVDDVVRLVALVGIVRPIVAVADADVAVKGDDLFAVAHVAQRVPLGVDPRLVKAQRLHLPDGAANHALLLAAFTRDRDEVAEKTGHLRQICLCCSLDGCCFHV